MEENRNIKTHSVDPESILPISIGNEVVLEFVHKQTKLVGKFVGLEAGRYVIVQMALPPGYYSQPDTVRDCPVIVRYLHGGSVWGLRTTIISISHAPSRLVFLKYPETIEEYRVRCAPRQDCMLPAAVLMDGQDSDALIIDISMGGCRFSLRSAYIDDIAGVTAEVSQAVVIKADLPGCPVAIALTGKIKNVSGMSGGARYYGMMFEGLTEEARESLETFLTRLSGAKKEKL